MIAVHPWRSWLVVPTLGDRAGVDTLGGGPPMEFKAAVQIAVDDLVGKAFHRCR